MSVALLGRCEKGFLEVSQVGTTHGMGWARLEWKNNQGMYIEWRAGKMNSGNSFQNEQGSHEG